MTRGKGMRRVRALLMLLASAAVADAAAFPTAVSATLGPEAPTALSARADSAASRNVEYVYLLHARETRYNRNINADAQILVGDVAFRHDSLYMYCDSALFYEGSNSLDAYGNVRMNQGDTLFLYGDRLYYDGNAQIAKVRDNVRMQDPAMTLLTDSLNYDRTINLGYYLDWGELRDTTNTLTSEWGEYNTVTRNAVFNYNVTLTNSRYTLTSDTLRYNIDTRVARISGPTRIVNDDNRIYSEHGTYDTVHDLVTLTDRSVVENDDNRLTADSIYYDRTAGYGEGFRHVILDNFKDRNRLTGNYVYYCERNDSAYATDDAMVTDYSQGDSLYLHGDTLRMTTFHFGTDSVYRLVQAYHKVRMYRDDVQAVCDSLVMNTRDSIITLHYDPIIWNGPQQVLGEKIVIYLNDSTIDWAHIQNQALIAERLDSVHFNQISGREVKAYFHEGEIEHADVSGNVMVIYYYREENDTAFIGMNTTEATLLTARMKERQVDKLLVTGRSNGIFYPMTQLPQGKTKLASFAWFSHLRPLSKEDTLVWRGKNESEKLKTMNRGAVPLPTLKGLRKE